MDIRQECLKAVESGYPIATIAKKIGRDPSTIHKWLKKGNKISTKIESEVLVELKKLKEVWDNVNV